MVHMHTNLSKADMAEGVSKKTGIFQPELLIFLKQKNGPIRRQQNNGNNGGGETQAQYLIITQTIFSTVRKIGWEIPV